MKILLRAKHWQIFLVLISPVFFQIPMAILVIKGTFAGMTVWMLLALTILFAILGATVLFLWMYTLATQLHERLPAGDEMGIGKFKLAFFYPVTYFILLLLCLLTIGDGLGPWIFFVIFPLHILAMFCMFYVLYFISKSLKMVELQRKVTFADYSGDFFLLWFYVIGIWFIQPRVNEIFKGA